MKRLLCRILGHNRGDQVVDCERRKCFNPCLRCGEEVQFDFQKEMDPGWIGYVDEEHKCPLCWGWKSRSWQTCGQKFCVLNPGFPLRTDN